MPELTFCEDCEHLHPESRNQPSYRAMCIKFPRLAGSGFVSREYWDKDSPYMYCVHINGGQCPNYEPRKGKS